MSHHVIIDGVEYIPSSEQPHESTLTKDNVDVLTWVIEKKGFDYGMVHYSSFDSGNNNQIDDQRFHQLRVRFLNARQELVQYLKSHGVAPDQVVF